MGILGILLMIVFVLSAILLVLIVLLQEEGGDSLGGIFGGGPSTQVGNRSGNILTRITSVLATVFLLSSFGLAWLNRTPDSGDVEAAARRLERESGDTVDWWVIEEEGAAEDAGE